jgi:hypothetical protein
LVHHQKSTNRDEPYVHYLGRRNGLLGAKTPQSLVRHAVIQRLCSALTISILDGPDNTDWQNTNQRHDANTYIDNSLGRPSDFTVLWREKWQRCSQPLVRSFLHDCQMFFLTWLSQVATRLVKGFSTEKTVTFPRAFPPKSSTSGDSAPKPQPKPTLQSPFRFARMPDPMAFIPKRPTAPRPRTTTSSDGSTVRVKSLGGPPPEMPITDHEKYYHILGLKPTGEYLSTIHARAIDERITSSYRKYITIHHPDNKNTGSVEMSMKINVAYDNIKDSMSSQMDIMLYADSL